MSQPQDPDKTSPDDPAKEPETPVAGSQGSDPNATIKLTAKDVERLDVVASDPDDPLVGTLLRNKWRVLGRIGSGSFGTVYKVRDVNGRWIEALKILSMDRLRGPESDNMRKRFLREAQIMKRLGSMSPHIVGLSTYEDDAEAGLIYFLMEHVEGRVLSEVLLQEGPLDVDRTVRIAIQVCDALITAHENEEPIVHRDLKLENIMLTKNREGEEFIKVLDFGIAKIAEQDVDASLTGAGSLGTPGYAAPEQLRAGEVDGRTDLFAFGVILYALVTGRNPWLGHLAYQPSNQTYELMAASDKAEFIPIADTGVEVPAPMVAIIGKLLQREPDDRFASARELRTALYALVGEPVTTGRLSLTRELTPKSGVTSQPQRRLAAVWFADLVGYSMLSSQDEEAALALLDAFHRTARRVIEGGGGRVVQFIGDAVFAEFSSTQRAVTAAKEFIDVFAREKAVPGYEPQLRIGVHVGDVLMAPDGDLFGDGVNIAARIQSEAEPGQILVSQDVWRQLRQRRDFGFHAIGERTLKGIGTPVSLFAVVQTGDVITTGDLKLAQDPTTGLPVRGAGRPARTSGGRARAAAAVVVLLGVASAGYAYATRSDDAATDTGFQLGVGPGDTPGTDPAPSDGTPDPEVADGSDATTPIDPDDPVDPPADPVEPPATTGGSATVTRPPPSDPRPVEETLEAPYRVLLPSVRVVREQAQNTVHDDLRLRLAAAESRWGRAEVAAGENRFADAIDELEAAEPLYAEVVADSESLRRIDQTRSAIETLRRSTTNTTAIADARALELEGEAATTAGRYDDAIGFFDRAHSTLRDAPPEPVAGPEVVETPAADVALGVLARLESALDDKDIERVRRIWTSMTSAEDQGLVRTFASVRNEWDATLELVSARREGQRVFATVTSTYHAENFEDASIDQLFELVEVDSVWTIVANRPVSN